MKINRCVIALAAALLSACSSNPESIDPTADNYGSIDFVCNVAGSVDQQQTRAKDRYSLPKTLVPPADSLRLTLQGTYIVKDPAAQGSAGSNEGDEVAYGPTAWASLSAYANSGTKLYVGTYAAHLSWHPEGVDSLEQGIGKPYYYAYINDIEVEARKYGKTVQASVGLINSCMTLATTKDFNNYYSDVEVKLRIVKTTVDDDGDEVTTETKYSFSRSNKTSDRKGEYKLSKAASENDPNAYASPLIFINPGQTMFFSATAKKADDGTDVTFNEIQLFSNSTDAVKTAADYHYYIEIDHSTAGQGGIEIKWNGYPNDLEGEEEVELNPEV